MNEPKVVFTFNAGAYAIDEDGDFFEDISGKWRRNSIRPDRMIGRELAALAARVEELEEALAESDIAELRRDGVLPNQQAAEITRLREALREYGHHKPHCSADPCTCGILEALQEASDE